MSNITSLIFILLLCANHYSVSAQPANILQVRTIAVSPYGIETNEKLSGIYYDLANRLLAKAGIESEHHIFPYGRIMHELKLGKTDLTIMFKYKELADYVDYIYPLPTLKNVIYIIS